MPPRTGLYLLAAVLLWAAIICGVLLATPNEPPTVAPLQPTGTARYRLWLQP